MGFHIRWRDLRVPDAVTAPKKGRIKSGKKRVEMAMYEDCLALYRELKEKNSKRISQGVNDYSLMNALLDANDEVRLHSRFIFSMLNPEGDHYCGARFLRTFLHVLSPMMEGFIDLERAQVYKEKGAVDLIIHDDKNFVIVENKLLAIDQKHQITRYIQFVGKEYFLYETDFSKNLAVVYLSKKRSQPADGAASLIGFKVEPGKLVWEGLPETQREKFKFLERSFPIGTEIPFFHYSYFPMLERWVEECVLLSPKGAVRNAFEEYRVILRRLNPLKGGRNILSLDQYVMNMEKSAQVEMLEFMIDARKALAAYIAAKLHFELGELFGDDVIAQNDCFRSFTVKALLTWLKGSKRSKERWKNIGFCYKNSEGRKVALVFATDCIYFGICQDRIGNSRPEERLPGGNHRKLLLEDKKGLYVLLEEARTRKERLKGEARSLEAVQG